MLDAGLLVDRSSRKRISILNWDFRENQPAQPPEQRASGHRGDVDHPSGGIGGQHLVAIDVAGDLDCPSANACARRARRLHVGKV